SQFTLSETVMTSIEDQFPHTFNTPLKRVLERACVCIVAFLLGIPMVIGSGQYLLDLIDGAELGYPVLFVGLMELVVVVALYGYDNFAEDIRCMVGFRPPFYFKLCWGFISPVLLVGVIVFKAYQHTPQEVPWADLIYWLAVGFPVFLVPGWWFYYTCTNSKMTAYTPAWRDRRLTSQDKSSTDDIEMDLTSNGKTQMFDDSPDFGPKLTTDPVIEVTPSMEVRMPAEGHTNEGFDREGEDIQLRM
ncbi:hypothetical protein BaRGS_00002023, partial [Batillaria attramentaria]